MSIMNIGYIFYLIYILDDCIKNVYGFNRVLLYKVCDKNCLDYNIFIKNKILVRIVIFKVYVEIFVCIIIL